MTIERRNAFIGAGLLGSAAIAARMMSPAAAQTTAAAAAPAFYHFRVGSLPVTVLHDGYFVFPNAGTNFVRNAPSEQVTQALRDGFLDPAGMRSPFHVTAVETSRGVVLFDAGTGGQLSPLARGLVPVMQAAGLNPARVTMVVFTHFHADHINGLTTADNQPVFPNAEIVVPAAEWAWWNDAGNTARTPEGQRGTFANVARRFGPYAGKVRQIAGETEVAPGIHSLSTPGHTPGHTSYLLSDGAAQAMVLGDVTNRPEVNLRYPDWQIVFDLDSELAASTRRRVLDRIAADRLRTIGYHWPFPANGFVLKDGSGYRMVPADWTT